MRWLRPFHIVLICVLLLVACGSQQSVSPIETTVQTSSSSAQTPAPATNELTVFAAASLRNVFESIGKTFGDANNVRITFNFAGSQQLSQQLAYGAPADVFASANHVQMQIAIDARRVMSGTQQTFVRNQLVVVTPRDNRAAITTLQDLAKPGLKLVFADKTVPVGQYALDFLDKAAQDAEFGSSYKDAVLQNVVSYEQSVKAVLAKIQLGEADAGIVYTSDIALDAGTVIPLAIPDHLNSVANFPIATVTDSKQPQLAQKFVDYVLSPEGQKTLTQYGFIAVKDK